MRTLKVALMLLMFLGLACDTPNLTNNELEFAKSESQIDNSTSAKGTSVQKTDVTSFQPAGDLGGASNVLIPGTFFAPNTNNHASLKRGKNYLQFNIHTTNLPQGAYTVWYIIFNDPSSCAGPGSSGGVCGENDLFLPSTSVVWATGKIVHANGIGNFSDRIYVGEQRTETIILGDDLNSPLEYPQTAEVHLIIKYHGHPSDDSELLYDQLHTLLGNCDENGGANSFDAGPVFGIQCFDPQVAVFKAN